MFASVGLETACACLVCWTFEIGLSEAARERVETRGVVGSAERRRAGVRNMAALTRMGSMGDYDVLRDLRVVVVLCVGQQWVEVLR